MEFKYQSQPIQELAVLAESKRHSILIEGPSGCGKTYLARLFGNKLGVDDFVLVDPSVTSIRAAITESYNLNTPAVVCIENLDKGVPAASYTLLKFLEEPNSNIYIVITCRNITRVPDTIVSRSACVSVGPPIDVDIAQYAQTTDPGKYAVLKDTQLFSCVRSFSDVNLVYSMSIDAQSYFESLRSLMPFRDSVSNIVWKLGHYADNSETPVDFVIRYLMSLTPSIPIRRAGIECVNELSIGRMAAHAVLTKFVFDCKYGVLA